MMSSKLSGKEITFTFAPAIISFLFTAIFYFDYKTNPECVSSANAGQCWDLRPLLIPALSILTVILVFSSIYKYKKLANEN